MLACLGLALIGSPRTPLGRHCPTAPVQTVVEKTVDCCGNLVRVERKPRPGEASFVQCRCAERKTRDAAEAGTPTPPLALADCTTGGWTLAGFLLAAPSTVSAGASEPTLATARAPSPPPPRPA